MCVPREQDGFKETFRNPQTSVSSYLEVERAQSTALSPSDKGQEGLKCKMTEGEVGEEIKGLQSDCALLL